MKSKNFIGAKHVKCETSGSLGFYIISPILQMRKEPVIHSEIVSQGLFSEEIQIVEEKEEWIKIKTLIDNYFGWTKKEGVCGRAIPYRQKAGFTLVTVSRLSAHLYDCTDMIYGPLLTLPFESRLVAIDFKEDKSRWLTVLLPDGKRAYIQRGDITSNTSLLDKKTVGDFSKKFLGLPYTWGGRTSFGYDCSGFIQMLYRQMGIFLPRDSQDQFSATGFVDSPIEELEAGDLAFWGYSKGQIRHVGLALGEGRFIHTSAVTENMPYLRISNFNDQTWNGSGYYPFIAGKKCYL